MAVMERLGKILKREKATSAEIRTELASLEGELPGEREHLAQLNGKRERLLLEGSDKDLDALEREIAAASREAERTEVAVAALRNRLEESVTHERQAELRAEVDAARVAADAILEERVRAVEAARDVANFLVKLDVVDRRVRASHAASRELGIPDVPAPAAAVHGNFVVNAVIPKLDGSGRTLVPPSDPERGAEVARLRSVA